MNRPDQPRFHRIVFRMLGAQLAGILIAAILSVPLAYFSLDAVISLARDGVRLLPILSLLPLFAVGLAFGLMEWTIQKNQISLTRNWLLVNTLLVGAIMIALCGLFAANLARFSVELLNRPCMEVMLPVAPLSIGSQLAKLALWQGALFGVVCGLSLGVIQSLLLRQNRRLWAGLTALLTGPVFFLVYLGFPLFAQLVVWLTCRS